MRRGTGTGVIFFLNELSPLFEACGARLQVSEFGICAERSVNRREFAQTFHRDMIKGRHKETIKTVLYAGPLRQSSSVFNLPPQSSESRCHFHNF